MMRQKLGKAPESWRVHHARDPEAELLRLRGRLEAISRRIERQAMRRATRRRVASWAKVTAWMGICAVAVYIALAQLSPWPPLVTLKHLASSPSCAAVRAMGLAPAIKGQPGYWPSHDADHDDKSCEPVPQWRLLGS
jgi:hypothetical protein